MECVYLVFVKVCLVFVYSILEQDLAERELRARGPLGKCFNDGTLGFQTAFFPLVDFHLFLSMRFGLPKLVVMIVDIKIIRGNVVFSLTRLVVIRTVLIN